MLVSRNNRLRRGQTQQNLPNPAETYEKAQTEKAVAFACAKQHENRPYFTSDVGEHAMTNIVFEALDAVQGMTEKEKEFYFASIRQQEREMRQAKAKKKLEKKRTRDRLWNFFFEDSRQEQQEVQQQQPQQKAKFNRSRTMPL